ncbi:sigma-E processing peptidase SpoIIGA [Ammoniphilus resinae]|uniref:Stage II sporulation protein GA (Sporulation sigma-E factor processing peptidase) n=1 Tax=Ammoniphilus resinae TaxID=861532 RepID=A0ABS4GK76_9BACL|nr:stage II sporulation protein GA (sporulation sigma-E factor processing peptidase) [Ammoniphilus resinae]
MTVYIDIIFLYNFLIDWILLWSTTFVLKHRVKWYRLTIGSGIGALYTIVLFFPSLSALYTFLSKLLLAAVMVFSTFGYHRIRVFLQRLLIFYLVSFVMGGGLLGLHYLLRTESQIISGIVMTNSGGFGTPITWLFICIGFPLIWWLSGKGIRHMKENNRKLALRVKVEILLMEQVVITCNGLVDTGNQLYEPITRTPVMIADLNLFEQCLPNRLFQAIKEKTDFSTDSSFLELDDKWLPRVRLIPFRSVSRGMDLLLAVRPDLVRIQSQGQTMETTKVLIGLNPVALSSDGSYQAIVHPVLIENEEVQLDTNANKKAI